MTQLFLRPGMMAVPLPLRPVMVFIHKEEQSLAAAFQQNALQRVNVGDEAEIAFDATPGRVFKGKVARAILDVVVAGASPADGRAARSRKRGRTPGPRPRTDRAQRRI